MRSGVLGILVLVAAWLGPALAVAAAPAWRVDPSASAVVVDLKQAGRAFQASFKTFTAEVAFAADDLAGSSVTIRIDVASFATEDAARDGQAKGAAWLDAAGHPQAVYRTTAFRKLEGDRYEVDAELSLHGVTQRLTHPVAIAIDGPRAVAEGIVPLDRVAFGIGAVTDPAGRAVGLEALVRFKLTATRS